jgi:hypothetical protein
MKFNSIEQGANVFHGVKRLRLYMDEINATPVIGGAEIDDLTRQELNTYLLRLYCNLLNASDEIAEIRKQLNK